MSINPVAQIGFLEGSEILGPFSIGRAYPAGAITGLQYAARTVDKTSLTLTSRIYGRHLYHIYCV